MRKTQTRTDTLTVQGVKASDKRIAYLGLRYLSPDCILQMRHALDLGVSVDKLRNSIKKQGGPPQIIQDTLDALDYMLNNPEAGVARFTEGERFNWADE